MIGVKYQRGYTLVEMLVTVSIFALAFTAIAAIFLGFTTAQSRASNAQKLLNEGNFVFEAIAREVRMHSIDYTCPGVVYADDKDGICLRSIDGGESIQFHYDSIAKTVSVCKKIGPSQCLVSDWRVLHPDTITVSNFKWHVFPTEDPLRTTDVDKMFHPLVTLQMTIEAGTGRARQEYDFQTAVTSRAYSF